MTWFRVGGGSGIPAALKSQMNDVLNKKFGTSIDYPPQGWPDDVNLMGPLPEKTIVSSPIADFSDGADDVPTKSLVVTIPPTISGVSEVTEKQTGRNLISANDESKTFSANVITNYDVASLELKKGVTYTFSAYQNTAITGSTRNTLRILFDGNNTYESTGTNYHNQAGVHSMSITPAQDGTAVFAIWAHTPNEDVTYSQFMVEYGSTAHDYEPYTAPTQYTASLGRTIHGGQVDIVNGTGTDENGDDFTFTGQEINTRLGYNAFWSEQGDTEVTYRADISLALQAVSGSRGLMMTRPAIEPSNGDQGSEESTENNIETVGEQDAR